MKIEYLCLKLLILLAFFTSDGSLFQVLTTLLEKKFRLTSVFDLFGRILRGSSEKSVALSPLEITAFMKFKVFISND